MDEPAFLRILYEVKLNAYFVFFSYLVANGYYLEPESKIINPSNGKFLTVHILRQHINEYLLEEVNSNFSPMDEVPLDCL